MYFDEKMSKFTLLKPKKWSLVQIFNGQKYIFDTKITFIH